MDKRNPNSKYDSNGSDFYKNKQMDKRNPNTKYNSNSSDKSNKVSNSKKESFIITT